MVRDVARSSSRARRINLTGAPSTPDVATCRWRRLWHPHGWVCAEQLSCVGSAPLGVLRRIDTYPISLARALSLPLHETGRMSCADSDSQTATASHVAGLRFRFGFVPVEPGPHQLAVRLEYFDANTTLEGVERPQVYKRWNFRNWNYLHAQPSLTRAC
jgi:hypothetical protein